MRIWAFGHAHGLHVWSGGKSRFMGRRLGRWRRIRCISLAWRSIGGVAGEMMLIVVLRIRPVLID